MYIQDSTLASAFDNAAAEYIEQTEAELLAEYKSIRISLILRRLTLTC